VPTPAAVRKEIAAGTPSPVYLLQGEDDVEKAALAAEFDELVEEGLRAFNVEHIHAADLTTGDKLLDAVASLVDTARTLPMMAARRVVTVFQAENMLSPKRESEAAARALDHLLAFVDAPEPQTTLVFVAAPLDRRTRMFKAIAKSAVVVECGAPEDVAAAVRWVRARLEAAGVEIDAAGARAMAVLAGFPERPRNDGKTGNVKRLRGEIERLLLYALGQKRVTIDDVREVAGPAALQDDWAIARAIENGQTGEALRQIGMIFEAGAVPEKVLGQLAYVVRSGLGGVPSAELERAVDAVFRTDVDLKRSAGDPRILLERLVVELCAAKRARAAAPRRW
jgi:DNA polymerase III subunit delta